MDDNRFEPPSGSFGGTSMSVEEKDRFRGGERNDAGDRDDWRSLAIGKDFKGASRFSSVKESEILGGCRGCED